jgi:HTH-type transcriptional regulator/antitoxin HigA
MNIQPIQTEADYKATLKAIELLMDAAPGSAEESELDVLATLVEAYEAKHYPIPKPHPIAALEHYLESRGLTRKALEPYIGSRGRVAEIMNRRRPLTLEMIRRLAAGTNIPASVLIQPYPLTPASSVQVEEVAVPA